MHLRDQIRDVMPEKRRCAASVPFGDHSAWYLATALFYNARRRIKSGISAIAILFGLRAGRLWLQFINGDGGYPRRCGLEHENDPDLLQTQSRDKQQAGSHKPRRSTKDNHIRGQAFLPAQNA